MHIVNKSLTWPGIDVHMRPTVVLLKSAWATQSTNCEAKKIMVPPGTYHASPQFMTSHMYSWNRLDAAKAARAPTRGPTVLAHGAKKLRCIMRWMNKFHLLPQKSRGLVERVSGWSKAGTVAKPSAAATERQNWNCTMRSA